MNPNALLVSYVTITRKEIVRMFRVWSQTLLPPVITMSLYFVVFGQFIGSQIPKIGEYSYMQFIVPGLVMMSVITSSFSHTVSSFYMAKFQRNLEEILVSPTPYYIVIGGFVTGGVLRGLLVGSIVLTISLLFTNIVVQSLGMTVLFVFLTAVLFSLAGLINGVLANSFDGISLVPTFVLTPLTYLGGVFYSIHSLPEFWQKISLFNPILYMVNGFRYGFLGVSDVNILSAVAILVSCSIGFFWFAGFLFRTGKGLKN